MQRSVFIKLCVAALLAALASPLLSVNAQAPDVLTCNNLCFKANDGICDDGAAGSATNFCPYASDCADCGQRAPYTRRPTPSRLRTVEPTPWVPPSTEAPTPEPTPEPTQKEELATAQPTRKNPKPTRSPTSEPTKRPSSSAPTTQPTTQPTASPTNTPSASPTVAPTPGPSNQSSLCEAYTTREACCGPLQAAKGECVYVGCMWAIAKRAGVAKCLPDVTASAVTGKTG